MKINPFILLLFVFIAITFTSCYLPKSGSSNNEKIDITVSKSISIPSDRESSPIPGFNTIDRADTTLVFTSIGQKFEISLGKDVNLVYEGDINPEDVFLVYEQTLDGYSLQLKNRTDHIDISFLHLCQTAIVGSPNNTSINIPQNMKYEQIIWTPRIDGSWEVRIGTTERGCKSRALQDLQKIRTKEYDKKVPR